MTSLVTADGRLLRRTSPGSKYVNQGGWDSTALWSNGETAREFYGDGTTTWNMVSYSKIYESQPIVASAVNKLCRQISTLPLKVYKKNKDNDRQRVTDGALHDLLEKPSPGYRGVHLKQWIFLPLLIHGNALLAKWREEPEGPPTELLPVDWAHVSAYAEQGGPIEWWSTTQTGQERFIHRDDVIHFAWQAPGGQVGVSPLQQLGVTIRTEDAVQRHTISNFRHGVNPSIAVTLDKDARPDQETRDLLRKSIDQIHGGPDNQGKAIIAGGGASVTTLSHSAREAELISVREVGLREVCMVYDTKPPVLGDFTHATYSNVEEGNKDFYKTTLRPWLVLGEETSQAQLIDPEPSWDNQFCEFDLAEQLKGDPLTQAQAIKTELDSGTLVVNEARKIQNREPFEEPAADEPHIMANNLKKLGEPDPAPPPPPVTTKQVIRDPNTKRISQIKETTN